MRVSEGEAMQLWDLPLAELGVRAHEAKMRRFADRVSYIRTYYLNVTNVCRYACKYCAFRRDASDPDAYTWTAEQIVARLAKSPEDLSEVWLSSGINPHQSFDDHLGLVRAIRSALPQVTIKGYTAVEIDSFCQLYDLPLEVVIERLLEAGLGRIPAGGAEIFDSEVRRRIDIKTRPERYLEIHRQFHLRGIPTAVTMLFGHIETRAHRIRHLETIRRFQDEGGTFQAIIPLAFQDQHNPLARRGVRGPGSVEILRTLAISRIYLDNVDHVQSFWVDSGEVTTQVAMHFGVDDINGTLVEENIAHESGSAAARYQSSDSLETWIRTSGWVPVERDALFRERASGVPLILHATAGACSGQKVASAVSLQ